MNTAGSTGMLGYYSWLGTSPVTIINNIFTHAQFSILEKAKLAYLFHLLLPLGFISLLSPSAFIMVLISLAEGLFSSRSPHFFIHYQYSSIITPYIFISAGYGLKNILRFKYFVGNEKIILILLVEAIPPEAPVIATFAFTPKLSMRPLLFYFYHVYTSSRRRDFIPNVRAAQKTARWALIDFNDWLTFYDFYTPGGDRDIYHFLKAGNWRMVETITSLVLFQKGNKPALGVVGIGESMGEYLPVNIQINAALRLLGYNLKSKIIRGSIEIGLDVLFECSQIIRHDLLFVARFDSRAELGFSFQQAFFAPYRIYPSTRWKPMERIRQSCNILIPDDAPSGNYDLTMILMVSKERRFSGNVIYKKPNAVFITAPQGW